MGIAQIANLFSVLSHSVRASRSTQLASPATARTQSFPFRQLAYSEPPPLWATPDDEARSVKGGQDLFSIFLAALKLHRGGLDKMGELVMGGNQASTPIRPGVVRTRGATLSGNIPAWASRLPALSNQSPPMAFAISRIAFWPLVWL